MATVWSLCTRNSPQQLPRRIRAVASLYSPNQPHRVSAQSCRWNTLKADEVGLHLQLLPVLLGFFTYKGAVIARGALDLCSPACPSSAGRRSRCRAAEHEQGQDPQWTMRSSGDQRA